MKSIKHVRRGKKNRQRSKKYTIRNKKKSKQVGGRPMMWKTDHDAIVAEHGAIVDNLQEQIEQLNLKAGVSRMDKLYTIPLTTCKQVLYCFCIRISGGDFLNYLDFFHPADAESYRFLQELNNIKEEVSNLKSKWEQYLKGYEKFEPLEVTEKRFAFKKAFQEYTSKLEEKEKKLEVAEENMEGNQRATATSSIMHLYWLTSQVLVKQLGDIYWKKKLDPEIPGDKEAYLKKVREQGTEWIKSNSKITYDAPSNLNNIWDNYPELIERIKSEESYVAGINLYEKNV